MRRALLAALPLKVLALASVAACGSPTSSEPRVSTKSNSGTAVEYSGERAQDADRKAQEACAQQGKRAVPRSMGTGAGGANVRNYDCAP
jgi:hypothetical protein